MVAPCTVARDGACCRIMFEVKGGANASLDILSELKNPYEMHAFIASHCRVSQRENGCWRCCKTIAKNAKKTTMRENAVVPFTSVEHPKPSGCASPRLTRCRAPHNITDHYSLHKRLSRLQKGRRGPACRDTKESRRPCFCLMIESARSTHAPRAGEHGHTAQLSWRRSSGKSRGAHRCPP